MRNTWESTKMYIKMINLQRMSIMLLSKYKYKVRKSWNHDKDYTDHFMGGCIKFQYAQGLVLFHGKLEWNCGRNLWKCQLFSYLRLYLLFENVANVLQDRNKDVKMKLSFKHQAFTLFCYFAAIFRLFYVLCFSEQTTDYSFFVNYIVIPLKTIEIFKYWQIYLPCFDKNFSIMQLTQCDKVQVQLRYKEQS